MPKGEVKKWRDGVDKNLKSLNDEVGGLRKWRDGVDKNLKSVDGEIRGLKKWRRKMDDWSIGVDDKLSKMATKKDLDNLAEHFSDLYGQLSIDISQLGSKMDVRHAEFLENMDVVMGDVKESRREREIMGYRYVGMDDKVADHEKRLVRLEDGKI